MDVSAQAVLNSLRRKNLQAAVSINATKSLCHGCLLVIFNELISQHGYVDNHTKRQVNINNGFHAVEFLL